jgi:Flp pilus assembly pilin Flp
MDPNDDILRHTGRALFARTQARPRSRRFRASIGAATARENGAALVEFALVLPVLTVLLFGVLEFGKLFNYWIDETHLTAEGARWAVVNNVPSGSSLQQYIVDQADSAELRSGAHVCISFPKGGTPLVGDPVQVDMSYNAGIPVVSGVLKTFFGGTMPSSITIRGSSTMRLEAVPTRFGAGNVGGSC